MRFRLEVVLAAVVYFFCTAPAFSASVGNAFTYQGRLNYEGAAVTAPQDLEFRLFDAVHDGCEIGSVNALSCVAVTHGLYSVPLNFGVGAFGNGARYLEIRVRPSCSGVAYTTLTPRQAITSVPVSRAKKATVSSAKKATVSRAKKATVKDGADNRAKISDDLTSTLAAHSIYSQTLFAKEPVYFHSVDKSDGITGFGTNFSPIKSGNFRTSVSITMSESAFPGSTALVYLCCNGVQVHTLGPLSVDHPLNREILLGIVAGDQISVTTLATAVNGKTYVDVAAGSQLRIVSVD